MIPIKKEFNFLNRMVKLVFYATFVFTGVFIYISWSLNWESLASLLVDKWFTIMVGELVIMGGIQIVKEVAQSRLRINEMKVERGIYIDKEEL